MTPVRVAAIGGLVAGALLCACTDDPDVREAEPTPTTSSVAPTSEPPDVEPTADPPDPITLAFAGDVHVEGVLRDRLDDLAGATSTLAAADLAMVNLETSVGTSGRPDPSKRFTFQAPPSVVPALAAAGIDVVTMANNHALDYGRDALADTFAAFDGATPQLVGLGRDVDEAFEPALVDVDGTVVATIGATTAALDPTADPTGQWAATATRPGTADAVKPAELLRAVARASSSADVVVVFMHWGVQGEVCATGEQRSLAADLVEQGADVVVGSHAHVLQGGEQLGSAYVAYGLGNYVWYQPSESGVLTLTVQPPVEPAGPAFVEKASWEPATVGADGLPTVSGRAGQFPEAC